MANNWYEFAPHGNTEVALFTLSGRRARTGAKGTRFFKKYIEPRPDAQSVVADALVRMTYVRQRWPRKSWGQPTGLKDAEEEIVLLALMLAVGRSEAEVDKIVASGKEPA